MLLAAVDRAIALYMDFKHHCIAKFDQHAALEITSDEVETWLRRIAVIREASSERTSAEP